MADDAATPDVASTVWVHWRTGGIGPGELGLLCLIRNGSRLELWDESRGPFAVLYRDPVTAVAFSPDGDHVATGSADGAARVWSLAEVDPVAVLAAGNGPVTAVAFSPDGDHVATGSADGAARVWSLAEVDPVAVLAAGNGPVTAVAFSPDGDHVATGSADGAARVWSLAEVDPVAVLAAGNGPVTAVAFSPDGDHVATGSADGAARVWSLAEVDPVAVLAAGNGPVTAVAFSPDGDHVATGSADGCVHAWAPFQGESHLVGELGARISSIAYSPDGNQFAAGNDGGLLWIAELDEESFQWDPYTGRYLTGPLFEEPRPFILKYQLPPPVDNAKTQGSATWPEFDPAYTERYQSVRSALDASFPLGTILYNPPDNMQVGVPELVEVRIAGYEDLVARLSEGLQGGGLALFETIEVCRTMTVSLQGRNFDVKDLSPRRQFLRRDDITAWDFDVSPRRRGEQQLELRVCLVVIESSEPFEYELPVMRRRIEVRVNPSYTAIAFARDQWRWIVTTLIALVAAVAAILAL